MREQYILGLLCLFAYKIFPTDDQLKDINFNEFEKNKIDTKNEYFSRKSLNFCNKGKKNIDFINILLFKRLFRNSKQSTFKKM